VSWGTLGRLLAQTGGVLLVTIALLLLIELGAGLVVGQRPTAAPTLQIPDDTVSRTLTWLELNPAPLVRDADLLWRNEPGARKSQLVNPQPFGRNDAWTIQNNSEGFRGPERATRDASANVLRIVCIGDSVTFGFNVDQPDTYPHQLEDVLIRRHPGHRFEVVNAGVPGWSWLQGLRFLELRGLALRPDIVVIAHGSNDQFTPMRARVTDEERLHLLGGPLARAGRALARRLVDTNSFRLVERLFPPPPFTPNQDSLGCKRQIATTGRCVRVSLDEITTAVREVHRLATAHHVALLVANLDFLRTPAVEAARRGAEAVGAPFVDTVAYVRARVDEENRQRAAALGLAPPENETAPTPQRPDRLVLRIQVPDGHAFYEVRGRGYFAPGLFNFVAPAYDDGTHGDERSGDGVHTAVVEVPAKTGAVEYLYHRDGQPEFRELPPSAGLGYRLIDVSGDTTGPIEVFARRPYLAERTHPNAEGHAIVAALVADALEALPVFRRFIEPPHNVAH
jgi:lysophospholipase L1-like esterase